MQLRAAAFSAIGDAKVLTPASVVKLYSIGFIPEVHHSIANE
jgi:hypothetical protein